ncbi:hypothetical protein K8352_06770 [Flavobacteriaceae bacterium F89]|uniref:Uncharacterized protein n=1 Tax=Cerina litoralis TaxID=2874477 RepID=A0AAE3EUD7_9FLAO|nr:hypothetical protein [Cerina litoralis]MCG2460444.1 hypothetical protein [Cerina litoralis]
MKISTLMGTPLFSRGASPTIIPVRMARADRRGAVPITIGSGGVNDGNCFDDIRFYSCALNVNIRIALANIPLIIDLFT